MSTDDPQRTGPRRARPGYSRSLRCGLLTAQVWLERGRVAARLRGDLDISTVGELAAALAEAQRQTRDAGLLLLLDELGFADSSGLGVIVGAFKRARAAGGSVALVGTPGFLAKTLRITGLAGHLPCFQTLEEAWAWLERPPDPAALRRRAAARGA